MPDYQNGKIYSIRSYQTELIYIGSTTQSLSKRLGKHISDYKNGVISSKELLKYDDYYIELIELFPCNSREELLKQEGIHIRKNINICVNCCIAGRTKKEYNIDNKERINEKEKQYRENNKEHIKEQKREYDKQHRENNKERIREKRKQYYENNKEIYKQKAKQYRENNKEKLKECKKKYRENNKEKINEKAKEYREKQKQLKQQQNEIITDTQN
jgi:hypothetical protein